MDVGRSMEIPEIGPSITRSSTGMGFPLPFLKRFRRCLWSSSLVSFWNEDGL